MVNRPCITSDWMETTLGHMADYINGRAFKPHEWGTSGLPIIRIEQINDSEASYDYYDGHTPLAGVKVAIITEGDYYQSYNFDDWMEKTIEEKTTNSNGEVSYILPSGEWYYAIIYTTDAYGDVSYDTEYLTYLEQDEEFEENIIVYFY